jgi:hypothetical protein
MHLFPVPVFEGCVCVALRGQGPVCHQLCTQGSAQALVLSPITPKVRWRVFYWCRVSLFPRAVPVLLLQSLTLCTGVQGAYGGSCAKLHARERARVPDVYAAQEHAHLTVCPVQAQRRVLHSAAETGGVHRCAPGSLPSGL